MADTNTSFLNLTKPEVSGSSDTWGNKLNTNFDTLDSLFSSGPALKVANGGTGATTAAGARTNLGVAAASHTHAIADVTDLQTTLDGKQPIDADLTAIAAIASTSGLLKKTAANTWSLDTTSYAALFSPAFTGAPTAPTPANGDNSTTLATTAFVKATSAPINSPAFTGSPTAPTPATADNSTAIATTAYVKANISGLGGGGGGGTVTSVAVSGGTTGLTTSGGPITGSGTITLAGTLAVANGGTGATTAAGAQTALGLGTAATRNTGTSGATVPLLNGANTWSSQQTFDSTGSGGTTISIGNLTASTSARIIVGNVQASGNTGQVGIETITNSTQNRVHAAFTSPNGVIGTITTNGTLCSYLSPSDYRLKQDVQPITGAMQRLSQLSPVRFKWKSDPTGPAVDGFIAHEVQLVVPEAISGEKDAVDENGKPLHQGIDPSKIVPLLAAALKEAVAKIDTLEARIATLEAAA